MADAKRRTNPDGGRPEEPATPPSSVVVLTGAGISAESGLPTFRSAGGLWQNLRVEDVASPDAFDRDPARVHRFYNARRRSLLSEDVAPNAAHRCLAAFERRFGGEFLLVTQNIDDLHERAGSERLIHMHGELLKKRCSLCGAVSPVLDDMHVGEACNACARTGGLRPHVVWFGEMPMEMDRVLSALRACDLFVSVGTSGNVYPAAGFVDIAASQGSHTVEINVEPSAGASAFREQIRGKAGEVLPRFLERIFPHDGAPR